MNPLNPARRLLGNFWPQPPLLERLGDMPRQRLKALAMALALIALLAGGSTRRASDDKLEGGGEGRTMVRRLRGARLQSLSSTDVTDVGEDTMPQFVAGGDDDSGGTSWIVGMHRQPMWTQAQTHSCGDSWPCAIGEADKGHFFQRGTNPFSDKREVGLAEQKSPRTPDSDSHHQRRSLTATVSPYIPRSPMRSLGIPPSTSWTPNATPRAMGW